MGWTAIRPFFGIILVLLDLDSPGGFQAHENTDDRSKDRDFTVDTGSISTAWKRRTAEMKSLKLFCKVRPKKGSVGQTEGKGKEERRDALGGGVMKDGQKQRANDLAWLAAEGK